MPAPHWFWRFMYDLESSAWERQRDWIDTWNDNPRPYVWVKTADQILEALGRYCERISGPGH